MTASSSVAYTWGSTSRERAESYPCDAHLPDADEVLFRAVDVAAPAAVVFRWLCQLKAAPYSYDWIDNLGRTSPVQLVPGLERLTEGDIFMSIFRLVAHEHERHITMVTRSPAAFGQVALTYRVAPEGTATTRLVVKFLVRYPLGLYGACLRWLLPWGDLLMMRKQLLTLKARAEDYARAGSG